MANIDNSQNKIVKRPGKSDIIFIPNRITNAKYNYSLIQEKIFNLVLFRLQDAIKINMNGGDYQQLDLFKVINSDRVEVTIPISDITNPNHYGEVRIAAENLSKTLIKIKQTNKITGKGEIRTLTLFGAVVTPDIAIRTSVIKIEMSKEVSKLLIEIDLNKFGKPSNYTSFELQITTNAKNKYTARIYKLISSWKEKGFFYMTISEFREWLEIGDKYKTYVDLKKNILLPVQKELENKALCWFDCKAVSFEKREGKSVVGLQWKVITPADEQAREIHIESIKNLLRMHLSFKDADIKQLEPIFGTLKDFTELGVRIVELSQYVKENSLKITNPKAYIISSILKYAENNKK